MNVKVKILWKPIGIFDVNRNYFWPTLVMIESFTTPCNSSFSSDYQWQFSKYIYTIVILLCYFIRKNLKINRRNSVRICDESHSLQLTFANKYWEFIVFCTLLWWIYSLKKVLFNFVLNMVISNVGMQM